jgi:hypothetical protein
MKITGAIVLGVLLSASATCHAVEHWSGETDRVTIFENGSAFMIVANPRGGTAGTFSCTQNVVYLGVKNGEAPKGLLAQVMLMYAMGKTMRFGIRGSGDACEAYYITAEP